MAAAASCPELVLRLRGPVEHGHRQRRVVAQELVDDDCAVGVEKPPSDRADEEQRRGLAERRASARMVPVRMPGAAAGSTSLRVTSQRDAPTP